jgi:hypothetical protein
MVKPWFSLLSSSVLVLLSLARVISAAEHDSGTAAWPNGPFVTSGRDIKNALGETIVYAGTNWPGHGEVMIPEGLQYQSVQTIVSKIKSLGMNSIRLTYAIQMIDQIYANGGRDTSVQAAFVNALGQTNGARVLSQFLTSNPSFTANTTRLQVFDAVVEECAKQQIYINLDNHMSRAAWCCGGTDGNTWFKDTDFNVDNWLRGLRYMADHGKSWPNLMSMSLRNELRNPTNNPQLSQSSYNWRDWYVYIRQGAEAVHSANPDTLIVLSGLDYDTTMRPVVQGTALTPGTGTFRRSDFAGYENKLVIELHNYNNQATNCDSLQSDMYQKGYQALHPEDKGAVNVFPVLMTEFGFYQNTTEWQRVYATCIADLLSTEKSGWFIWVLAGSYYIRSGTQDFEETWGLVNHDWTNWRAPSYIDGGLKPLIRNTVRG